MAVEELLKSASKRGWHLSNLCELPMCGMWSATFRGPGTRGAETRAGVEDTPEKAIKSALKDTPSGPAPVYDSVLYPRKRGLDEFGDELGRALDRLTAAANALL